MRPDMDHDEGNLNGHGMVYPDELMYSNQLQA